MAENTLAALVAYEALGLPLERAQEGADAIELSRWRGEEIALPGGGFVVNDAYNANPTSMRAALLDLVERAGRPTPCRDPRRDGRARRRLAALPREIGALARRARDRARGRGRRGGERSSRQDTPGAKWISTPTLRRHRRLLEPGDAILVKASRAVGLEGIPARIEKRAGAWSES